MNVPGWLRRLLRRAPVGPEPERPQLSEARWNGLRCVLCGCKLYTGRVLCTSCHDEIEDRPQSEWAKVRQAERERQRAEREAAGEAPPQEEGAE